MLFLFFMFFPPYFNPLPPYGGRPPDLPPDSLPLLFQSTPSVWRETGILAEWQMNPAYFNPLPPYGGRRQRDKLVFLYMDFNPLPPYGGRPVKYAKNQNREKISIHSLRMEGDFLRRPEHLPGKYFNPLPPYGGRRGGSVLLFMAVVFQSTPSVWRETKKHLFQGHELDISIHSLRMEGDYLCTIGFPQCSHFNPLPPYGGRRNLRRRRLRRNRISIHSLRMEGDFGVVFSVSVNAVISIHSLRMEGDHGANVARKSP